MNGNRPSILKSNVHAKWGDAAIGGFQAVPDILLKRQKELALNPTDLVVLLNVLMHWWYADSPPFPRPTVIAHRMGLNVRSVQRSVKTLEATGLIRRSHDLRGNSILNTDGLVAKLNELVQTDIHFLIRKERIKAIGQI